MEVKQKFDQIQTRFNFHLAGVCFFSAWTNIHSQHTFNKFVERKVGLKPKSFKWVFSLCSLQVTKYCTYTTVDVKCLIKSVCNIRGFFAKVAMADVINQVELIK